MKYRRMGKSGLKLSEIAIGAWLICDGTVEAKTAEAIVRKAVDLGINFVDIADRYANGNAEEVVGRAIKGMQRSDLVISSKVFWPMSDNINDRGLSRKHIMESIEKSLQRIGTDYLDIYFCHRFDPETEVEEVVRAMDDLIHHGKILYWGTSVWSPAEIERAIGEARILRACGPAVEQPRYNMIDRHIEGEVMDLCRRYGVGLTVWSPLAQGLLTGKYNDGVPKNSRGDITQWLNEDLTAANIQKVRKLVPIAEKLDITLSQLALAWVLRRPEISCALTGATRVEQLEQNVIASDVELPDETLTEIETILGNDPNKRL